LDNKTPEELDRYLRKFAIEGREKLVNQLRQMLKQGQEKPAPARTESDKSGPQKSSLREYLFSQMDYFKEERDKKYRPLRMDKIVIREILCRPPDSRDKFDIDAAIAAINNISAKASQNPAIFHQSDPDNLRKSEGNVLSAPCDYSNQSVGDYRYWAFSCDTGQLYVVNTTRESIAGKPDIFDPKAQSLFIVEVLMSIGQLYYSLGLGPAEYLELAFRYSDATHLAVGSIGAETFLPSREYNQKYLTLFVARSMRDILGKKSEITVDIVMELLKRLKYQGIVNRDFFMHAIMKHLT